MQGHFKIFQKYVEPRQAKKAAGRKGRSDALIHQRNELMMYRYYYYIKICRYQYMQALQQLEQEFFIKIFTIISILQRNDGKLSRIMHEKASVDKLQSRYPWLSWK